MAKFGDSKILVGGLYGRLTAIKITARKKGHVHWLVLCECGGRRVVTSDNLLNGTTRSCGCLRHQPRKKRISRDAVRELYVNGLSTRQVAAALNISKHWAYEIVKELGISRSQSVAAQLRQPPSSKHWRSSRAAARRAYQRHHKVKLESRQHVHHINGDFTDNRIENLTILDAGAHTRHHHPKNPIPRWLRPARREYQRRYQQERAKQKKATRA